MTLIPRSARCLLLASSCALLLGPLHLFADPIDVTYQFTGVCADCEGTGVGALTLQNYISGSPIVPGNFVSFTYSSNILSFSIPSPDELGDITGMLPGSLPSTAFVDIQDTSIPSMVFISFDAGNWCVGTYCGADNGGDSSWSTVEASPEPASLIPVAAAVLCFGVVRRRRAGRA